MIQFTARSPTDSRFFYATKLPWVAIHGFLDQVATDEATGLDMGCFGCNCGGFDNQADCDTLADAIDANINFTGPMGVVQRLDSGEIECPTDTKYRRIGGRYIYDDGIADDGYTPYRVEQIWLEDFSTWLRQCGGFNLISR
jgi:hypothetical protein